MIELSERIYAKINKDALRFIRISKGVTIDYLAEKTKINAKKLELWEDEYNESFPTINQAKTLAKVLRVPFAAFYMIPENIDIAKLPKIINKRTLQSSTFDESGINLAIIDLINYRNYYIETIDANGDSISLFDLSINSTSVVAWAMAIREYFEISFNRQKASTSRRQFYLYLRNQIEQKGIFVQNFSGVDVSVVRGVAIADGNMPIIGINAEDRYPAKTFSMIHELVHIIKRTSVICDDIFNNGTFDNEEVFCNAVAAETIVPKDELISIYEKYNSYDIDSIEKIANVFSVSSEVIARRLYDLKKCTKNEYELMKDKLEYIYLKSKEDNRNKGKTIPRNMPREGFDKTSGIMMNVLIGGYSEGLLNKKDLSGYTGIKEKHIDNLVMEVVKWNIKNSNI